MSLQAQINIPGQSADYFMNYCGASPARHRALVKEFHQIMTKLVEGP
jgi:hypothetical protein